MITKEKIFGMYAFLGATGWLIAIIVAALSKDAKINTIGAVLILMLSILWLISIILYVFWTKGFTQSSDLEKIDYENKLLSKKIEQKELKKKLDTLGNNK